MTSSSGHREPDHDERFALAGYVTGGLSVAQQRAVERHLESCAECRKEVEALQALHADIGAALDAEPGPAPRVRAAVFARIASGRGTEAGEQQHRGNVVVHPRARRHAPSLPRWAQAAAIVLIVVQAGLLVRTQTPQTVGTADVSTRGLTNVSTRLRVVFDPQATETQIREMLIAAGAHIVGGPSPAGEYLIELTDRDPKSVTEKLRGMRLRGTVLRTVDLALP